MTKKFDGLISGIDLIDLIQLQTLSLANCALEVSSEGRQGTIYFLGGEVIHAEFEGLQGEEAMYEILKFKDGKVKNVKLPQSVPHTIKTNVSAILIEAARRRDEESRPEEELLMDIEKIEFNLKETRPKECTPHEMVPNGDSNHNKKEDEGMSEIRKLLNHFTEIPGVNTACLVGRDGFLVESIATSGLDVEMIGAIASSGFGASENMGQQLGKGPMALSMIEYEKGPVMLAPVGDEAFLVIVADPDSNLGLIRLKIRKHAKEIQEVAAI